MILSDKQIRTLALQGMITPFVDSNVSKVEDKRVVSYGLTSYGYDVRLAGSFKIFHNAYPTTIDPKNFDPAAFLTKECQRSDDDYVVVPPNSFVLGRTVERMVIPRDVLVLCIGKSTYARCGIIVNVTPLEPEWEGFVTLEISNTTPLPAKVYAYEGIAQFLFLRSDSVCETSYADKKGKYQNQEGVVTAKV